MPPARTGVAVCSAQLVSALRRWFHIDVFTDGSTSPAGASARSAHDFVWMHRRAPYDLTVFQLGNSAHHEFLWPYLFRYPGLAVLHDLHLHHARAASLLRAGRAADYRLEFVANHPEAHPDLAELAIAGFDSHLHYHWPMTGLVVRASRLTAVHGRELATFVRQQVPAADVEPIALGHGSPLEGSAAQAARSRVRAHYGIPADSILFGCYGGLSREKRIPQLLDAFAATRTYVRSAHLLLAGAAADPAALESAVRMRGLDAWATMTGYVEDDEALDAHIAACDVAINLRWPTAREISGPWLRCLAAGKPTVIIQLAHLNGVPSLDPRTWTASTTLPGTMEEPASIVEPICVAIDILDEDHSLRLTMRRLAGDAVLREQLGRAARAYWSARHSPARMVEDYVRVIPLAAQRPQPEPVLPRHLVNDGDSQLRRLLAPFALPHPLR